MTGNIGNCAAKLCAFYPLEKHIIFIARGLKFSLCIKFCFTDKNELKLLSFQRIAVIPLDLKRIAKTKITNSGELEAERTTVNLHRKINTILENIYERRLCLSVC